MPKDKKSDLLNFSKAGDLLNYVTDGLDKRRKDIQDIIRSEVANTINKLDLASVVVKALQDVDIEVNATLKIKPKNKKPTKKKK